MIYVIAGLPNKVDAMPYNVYPHIKRKKIHAQEIWYQLSEFPWFCSIWIKIGS